MIRSRPNLTLCGVGGKRGRVFQSVTESYNIRSWKTPVRIKESNSWLCTGQPKKHIEELSSNASWILIVLRPWPLPLGAFSSSWPPSERRAFCEYPVWTSPDAVLSYSLASCHWKPERGDQYLPLCSPSWGSCRQQQGHPSVSSKSWTNLVSSCPQPLLIFMPSSPFIVFFSLLWTHSKILYPFYILDPKTSHSTWGKAAPAEYSVSIASLAWLATLCLMQPRTQLALCLPGHIVDSYWAYHQLKFPDFFLWGCTLSSCSWFYMSIEEHTIPGVESGICH